jgi:hypothetical protein
MSYIGASPTTAAFPFDQFSGNGSTTAFTMSYAPASTTSIVVSVSGVVQNPNTYSVSGLTITFSGAPPTGTNNIGVLFLGLPASGVTTPGNTAYLSTTQFTATAGQTTFTPSGTYQTGFINVIRNGSQLAPTDYTATNGTTVVLSTAASLGDVVVIEVYNLTSVTNALPLTGGTVTGATTFNSTVSINGANGSGYTGYKNRIINPGMVISQRSTSATTVSGSYVALDRFRTSQVTTAVTTMSQSTDVPTGFQYSLRLTVNTADTSIASGDVYVLQQLIEGFNVVDLVGQTFTISFWVRSSKTGIHCLSLCNAGVDRSYVAEYTIAVANTWEYKTITVSGGIPSSGTWNFTNGNGLDVRWALMGGTTFQTTANSWNNGNFTNTSSQVNVLDTVGNIFAVTGVQLERGSNATSFEFRDYGRELQMCQRYYYQSTNYASASFTYLQADFLVYGPLSAAGNWLWACQRLQVPMRVAPTVTTSDQAGTTGKVSLWTTAGGSQSNGTTPYTVYTSVNSYTVSVYNEAKYGFFGAIKADAEI